MENVAADALSRKFDEAECKGLTVTQPKWITEVMDNYSGDTKVQELITQLCVDPNSHSDVKFQQGILRHQGQIWVGSNGQLRSKLISKLHSTHWGVHSGVFATQQRIENLFYWPNLLQDIKKFVKEYEVC